MSNPSPERPEPFGPAEFQAETAVSRETLDLLQAYIGLLKDWNTRHNLVSEASVADVWHRHVFDSAQLAPFIPEKARTMVDLGSGAGFPGLVLAILKRQQLSVTLFESTGKKADFLKTVAGTLKLPVTVRQERIEAVPRKVFDVVTARALAPLPLLLSYAQQFTGKATLCLFLKGQSLDPELTEAAAHWKMNLQRTPSRTHPLGVILEIRDLVDGKPSKSGR